MGDYRIDIESSLIVPKKLNAEAARDSFIKMIKSSGFLEKDFEITVSKTEINPSLAKPTVKIEKKIKDKKKIKIETKKDEKRKKIKKVNVVRNRKRSSKRKK
jgi:hypothetical protein